MTDTRDAPNERDEIELLIPWYATGRINAVDRARVAAWIARDEGLARQLEIIQEERRSAIESAEALPAPPRRSADAVVSRASPPARAAARIFGEMTNWIDSLLARLSPPALRWAAAAAVLLIGLQAAGLAMLLGPADPDPTYRTASGPPARSADGTFVLMQPTHSARIVELDTYLKDLEATIVDGPTLQGLYRVRIGPADLHERRRKEIVDQMRKRNDIFQLVTPEPTARPKS